MQFVVLIGASGPDHFMQFRYPKTSGLSPGLRGFAARLMRAFDVHARGCRI